VSVTQQFNTTSSKGGLTLNVLLSLCPVRAGGHRRAHPRQAYWRGSFLWPRGAIQDVSPYTALLTGATIVANLFGHMILAEKFQVPQKRLIPVSNRPFGPFASLRRRPLALPLSGRQKSIVQIRDVVGFDEVADLQKMPKEVITTMKTSASHVYAAGVAGVPAEIGRTFAAPPGIWTRYREEERKSQLQDQFEERTTRP